jgi:hypothetical protein
MNVTLPAVTGVTPAKTVAVNVTLFPYVEGLLLLETPVVVALTAGAVTVSVGPTLP